MFPHALKSERQIAKYKSLVFDATPQDKITSICHLKVPQWGYLCSKWLALGVKTHTIDYRNDTP